MQNYLANSEDLEDIASAIRAKANTTLSYAYPYEFIDKIKNLKTYGNSITDYIDGTVTSIFNNQVSCIPVCRFEGYKLLESVNFPHCKIIENQAFLDCTLLSIARFPECESIGELAFAACSNLTELDISQVTSIPTLSLHAFEESPLDTHTKAVTIYIPSSLYSNFVADQNWGSYSSYFVGV